VIPPFFEIVGFAIGVAMAAFALVAIVSIARTQSVTPVQRVVWVLAVVFVPVVGAIVWLATSAIENGNGRKLHSAATE
jgi:hypothetical protein